MARHYLTTPLYYVNARPHIGHAYATVLVDTMARYHRFFGDEVYFLTGTDEHGQKVMKAAEARGKTPIEHADEMSAAFRDLWPTLDIAYDDFIRTTEPRHIRVVQQFLQQLWDKGEIYEADYEGWYSPAAERFWAESELVDGKCPDTGLDVHFLKERNYFFRMGKYADRLRAHLEQNPDFIQPEYRKNEILGFLGKRVDDLCISRPKERLSWGIPIPFAPDFVTYVWFDALSNYVSALGGPGEALYEKWWPHATHVIGKDILTTHAVYWCTMLMALELPLPQHIIATGWWLSSDRKMSKSLGNVVDPLAMKDIYGPDVFRYFLMREMVIGLDANFSESALVRRNNSDLANDLGNLERRIKSLAMRHFDGKVPDPGTLSPVELDIVRECDELRVKVPELVRSLALHSAIEQILQFVRRLNKYVTESEPFKTIKTAPEQAARSIYVVLEGLRHAANLLSPVMPKKMPELLATLGQEPVKTLAELAWGGLAVGTPLTLEEGLFPRRDLPEEVVPEVVAAKADSKDKKDKKKNEPEPPPASLSFDDFVKVDLAVATVLSAAPVEGADKLLRLEVDLGAEKRQIVSGIAKFYTPAELVGRQVVVVRNLAPRKIFKLDSHGMILAAETPDGGLALIQPSLLTAPGIRVT